MSTEVEPTATAGRAPREDPMEHLLRVAGPRLDVPADRAERVRRAVHTHWETSARRRGRRARLQRGVAALATAAALIVAARVAWRSPAPPLTTGGTVATVERLQGTTQVLSEVSGSLESHSLTEGVSVSAGDWLVTDADSRAALRLSSGVSIRLDTSTHARLHSVTLVELSDGALYVDSGEDGLGLEVRTPWGTARDVGTQFEVRLGPSTLRVRVRTGVVELRRDEQTISARPGTALTVTEAGAVSEPVPRFGSEWDWAVGLAPELAFDNRPLAEFLEDVTRELGWVVRYADDAGAHAAERIMLYGAVTGLSPREAVAVALTTSGLDHRLDNGVLMVFPAEAPDETGEP